MCGIAGWIGYLNGDRHQIADRLALALRHRGPDANGTRFFDHAALIHTRLSIIDLSELGAQPMSNEDQTTWVTFNGEIYNHHDIRNQLIECGHVLRGRSDTEILPHLYEDYDTDLPKQIRGMFSIAIYDDQRKRLLLIRDRFGIKPLFYAATESSLAFASEINALKLIPQTDLRPDRQAIADYAALHYIPAPQTAYLGIRALEPGEILEARWDNGRIEFRIHRYHQWNITINHALTLEDAIDEAEALLRQGVQSQLESDVPLGALLSGGIDSSLVSVAAQDASQVPLHTFNVGFDDEAYDETWAAQAVAKHIGSQHQTLAMVNETSPWNYITSLLYQTGQPFADTSLLAVNLVSQAMRKHVVVALSGDGGDEAFGGYGSHLRLPQLMQFERLPLSLRQFGLVTASWAARIPAALGAIPHQIPHRLADLAAARDTIDLIRPLMSWMRDKEQYQLLKDRELLSIRRHFLPRWTHDNGTHSSLESASAVLSEAQSRLQMANDYLFKVDAASMRHSLEIRVPMLDEDLFAFGLTLPHCLKAQAGMGKRVLRGIAAHQLPTAVAQKPKQGFAVPVDRWVDSDFRERLQTLLLGPQSVLPEFFRPESYCPIIEAFSTQQQHRTISRAGLYQRAIMLLGLQVHFGDSS